MEQKKQTIGLAAAIFTLVGYVIGPSIYILPGELGAKAGPAVFLAYLAASLVAVVVCLCSAQIGNVFPVRGANYISISRVLSPFWGFMFVWMVLLIVATSIPAIAYACTDFLSFFIPSLAKYRMLATMMIIALLVLINVMGVSLSVRVQAAMVIGMIASLWLFGFGGMANSNWNNFIPLFPNGTGPVIRAALPAYFSYAGFIMIISLGDEIRRPTRNIPITLGASFLIVLVTYSIVALAVTGLIPWQQLSGVKIAAATAADAFLPRAGTVVIMLSALLAAATSVNGSLLGKSRDLFALARDGVLPEVLGRSNKKHGGPDAAIIFIGCLAIAGVTMAKSFAQYATMTVLCLMVTQILAGAVILLLPRKLPEQFARAPFKLPAIVRVACGVSVILVSFGYIVIGTWQSLRSMLLFLAVCSLGGVVYAVRKSFQGRQVNGFETLSREES